MFRTQKRNAKETREPQREIRLAESAAGKTVKTPSQTDIQGISNCKLLPHADSLHSWKRRGKGEQRTKKTFATLATPAWQPFHTLSQPPPLSPYSCTLTNHLAAQTTRNKPKAARVKSINCQQKKREKERERVREGEYTQLKSKHKLRLIRRASKYLPILR